MCVHSPRKAGCNNSEDNGFCMSVLRTQQEVVGAEVVGPWLSCLDEHSRTVSIDLPGKLVDDETACLLGSLALRCPRLREIKLSENRIGDSGAATFAQQLCVGDFQVLNHLDLSANSITAPGADDLARMFFLGTAAGTPPEQMAESEASERVFDLSGNDLGDAGVENVAKRLGNRKNRRPGTVRIRLRRVGCGDKGLKTLLSFKEAIGELDFSENPIGIAGAETVCRAVSGGAPWHTLTLDGLRPEKATSVSPEALGQGIAAALSQCVDHFSGLRALSCNSNNLGDAGAARIVEALFCNEVTFSLERLSLMDNRCERQTATALKGMLRVCGGKGRLGLRQLRLDKNRFGDESAGLLAEGFECSAALSELFLAQNQITSKGAIDIANALRAQRFCEAVEVALTSGEPGCLIVLDLSSNPIGDDGAEAIAKSASEAVQERDARNLQAPWGLEKLFLQDTRVKASGCDALCMAVASRASLLDASLQSFREPEGDLLLHSVHAKRTRRPCGLHVYGLLLEDREAVSMRDVATQKLAQLWPGSGHPGRPLSALSHRARASTIASIGQAPLADWKCNQIVPLVDEAYFPVEIGSADSRVAPLRESGIAPHPKPPVMPSQQKSFVKQTAEVLGETLKLQAPAGADPSAASSQDAPPSSKGKGKGKGKGAAPPPPNKKGEAPAAEKGVAEKGKGKGGKGPPPPKGKAKAGPPQGKAPAAAKAKAVPEKTPFGRRIHWVNPLYEEPEGDSIFAELFEMEKQQRGKAEDEDENASRPEESPLEFDTKLLHAMFGADDPDGKAKKQRRPSVKAVTGITVLTGARAQNMAIVLGRLLLSTQELCDCLQDLDFSDPRLTAENIELLVTVLPTSEESKKLLEHREAPHLLRDIEQKVMPFCKLDRCEQRLRIMGLALTHRATYHSLKARCEAMSSAAEEARKSRPLKKAFGVVLRVCNFINHGAKDLGAKGAARGFALESLSTLSSFKMGQVSTMHFIVLTMMASDQKFFKDLHESLQHIHQASREKMNMLSSCIEAFGRDAVFLRREFEHLDESVDATVKDRMNALVDQIVEESDVLKENVDLAVKLGKDAQKYFSGVGNPKSQAAQPIDVFFGHLASFLNSLDFAKDEIEKNPVVYKKFLSAGDKNGGSDKVGLLLGQSKPRGRAATDAPSKSSDAEATKAQPKTLRRMRTTADFVPQEDRLGTIRENARLLNLSEVGPRPSAGTVSSAPSCNSSTAGSDVAFMLDVDEMIDSIFSLCCEDKTDVQSVGSQDPSPTHAKALNAKMSLDKSDAHSMSSHEPCSTQTTPTNAKAASSTSLLDEKSVSDPASLLKDAPFETTPSDGSTDAVTQSLEASTCGAQDDAPDARSDI